MGGPLPPLLAAGIQGYCFSSFDLSWDWVSAASGWNFIAAEEYGRWVCPGGNSYVVQELWRRLVRAYAGVGGHGEPHLNRLRPGTRVVDVRQGPRGMMQVTYRSGDGPFRSLLARRVVMANSKHVCKYILHDLENIDPDRLNSMHEVNTHPYVVANVLLDAPIERDFYDLFFLRDGNFPMTQDDALRLNQVIDAVSGHWVLGGGHRPPPKSVLTLYWPLPTPGAMFPLVVDEAWEDHATRLAPQVEWMVSLLGVPRSAVVQVRMSRWGHSMPLARREFIARGHAERLRAPYLEHIYFVNQDNWALPAFETCLLEAQTFAEIIRESL
jgi:hypothetical protein